jgi:hypothetical protein
MPILFVILVFVPAYGDGLASETLQPSTIGNRNVTFAISSTPFLIDSKHTGTQISFVMLDVTKREPIENDRVSITILKGNNTIFAHAFKSDSGNFILSFYPESSENISVNEKGGLFPGLFGHIGSYNIKGPIFYSGGLYRFKIYVLTLGSYDNQVSKSYNAGISIPEYDNFTINDVKSGNQRVQIIAYYDNISDFKYEPSNKSINFTMPFDWSQYNIDQVSVVHQEIKIPRTFADYIVPKYEVHLNNIIIPDKSVVIDDYSSDTDRIIHLIFFKEDIRYLMSEQQNPKQEMTFSIRPNEKNPVPIVQFTRNGEYKISHVWDPQKIVVGSTVRFNFDVLDPHLINKTLEDVSYEFSVIEGKDRSIYHETGKSYEFGQENTIDVKFPYDYFGPVTIEFRNLGGNSSAYAEFYSAVRNYTTVPEFSSGYWTVFILLFMIVILFSNVSNKETRSPRK